GRRDRADHRHDGLPGRRPRPAPVGAGEVRRRQPGRAGLPQHRPLRLGHHARPLHDHREVGLAGAPAGPLRRPAHGRDGAVLQRPPRRAPRHRPARGDLGPRPPL
ncbi:MAG: hypothetical protein AVDCRST_MAG20-1803, partial [uncultured Acidimicrobiales bacterium]